MSAALGITHVALGLAYCFIGVLTLSDLKRGWKDYGFSHFGAAWAFIALTCGPHHIFHGMHLAFEGRSATPLGFITVGAGLPFGLTFLSLRIEAALGGRGDRFIAGTPWWLQLVPPVAAVYVTGLVLVVGREGVGIIERKTIPNLLLIALYSAIWYFLLRTQLRNRPLLHGWSLSGVALSIVFPTCTLMHAVYAINASKGLYPDMDWHGLIVDWVSVPASIYFLWVVRGLYKRTLPDWNRSVYDAVHNEEVIVVRQLVSG